MIKDSIVLRQIDLKASSPLNRAECVISAVVDAETANLSRHAPIGTQSKILEPTASFDVKIQYTIAEAHKLPSASF